MNSNNLIAGFEDVITHIRQQEFRIKELEAHKKQSEYQIEKLKKENEATEEALKIVKEENEVNKKNLYAMVKQSNIYIEEKNELADQIDQLGELCKNIDENAYDTWKEITSHEESESESEEEDQECFSCEKVMNMKTEYENCDTSSLVHTAYKWYLGSEHDCGDCCQDCVVTIYQEES